MAPTLPVEFTGQKVSKKLSSKDIFCRKMGKTRKVSKGYSNGFVPDYRHAVETMADSEGYLDTEKTGSEDSCGMGRKFLNPNPNVESCQQFKGVPIQVISLSKLSSFERNELDLRLKRELEQVKLFQKNLENVLSLSGSQSKKRGPTGRNANWNGGSRSKKAVLQPIIGNAMLMKQCETLLDRLMGQNFGWVFNTPVDEVALNIPDYYTVIKHPMDLGTVKTKLNAGKYADPWGFAADVRLTFSNALTYNPRGNDVHVLAETFSKYFEVRWKPIEKKLSVPIRPNIQETEIETEIIPIPPLKKKKSSPFASEIKKNQEPVKRTMSVVEKQKISVELEALLAELPDRIIDFLKENSSNGNATEDEIEIDIDILSDDTLFKLRKLLDDFLVEKQKNTVKANTCEIELHNESGLSNSSMPAGKVSVNDVNEEDVDIGGNDVSISSFPPVEIEKDTAVRDSKCSSSSSDSGSSTDSDSSSGSESDAEKPPAIVNNIKDTMGAEVNTEQTTVPIDTEVCVNGLSQVQPKTECVPINDRQEGESAPSERQVSPDKLYRAALLRSRFADTILNAQVKTNGKVEKQDIERLRLEKEELEKRRKEEKARLQAKAKAAEEALRIAELEAAAEAKRKRELEREAARQALQKMEKMVDINDSSRFLEDLEMLNAAPAEPFFIDETSVDCCPDPLLGTLNFQGKGNALEQLGLFMKNDDEDEEDVEPQDYSVKGNDPEEEEVE